MGGMLNGQFVSKPMIGGEIVNGMIDGEIIWGDSEDVDYIELFCTTGGEPYLKNQWSQVIKYQINDGELLTAPQDGLTITLATDDILKVYESEKGVTFRGWAAPTGNGGLIHNSNTCEVEIIRMPKMSRFTSDTSGTTLPDNAFKEFARGCITKIHSGFNTSKITEIGDNVFYNFSYNASDYSSKLESLPLGSFKFDNLVQTGTNAFQSFIHGLTKFYNLPSGSFNFTSLTTVGNEFCHYFTTDTTSIVTLPSESFAFPALETTGTDFCHDFNLHGSLELIPLGSFNFPSLTSVGDYFCTSFNNSGQLRCLVPGAFSTTLLANNNNYYMSNFNTDGKLPRGNENIIITNHNPDTLIFTYYNGNAGVNVDVNSGDTMSYHSCSTPTGEYIEFTCTSPGGVGLQDFWNTDIIYIVTGRPARAVSDFTEINNLVFGNTIRVYESKPGVTFRSWKGRLTEGILFGGDAVFDLTRMPRMNSFTVDNSGTDLPWAAFYNFMRSPVRNIVTDGFDTSNIVTMGDWCFSNFCKGDGCRMMIENLGNGNFRFPNLTSVSNDVLVGFASEETSITGLPAFSFNFNILQSVGDNFCASFAQNTLLTCIPYGSFNPDELTSWGVNYLDDMLNNARVAIDNDHYTCINNPTDYTIRMYSWDGSNQYNDVSPPNGVNYHTCNIIAPNSLTITGATSVTPKWTVPGEPLMYSFDNETWTDAESGTSITVNSESISFIGTSRTGLFNSHNSSNRWIITGNNVSVSGRLNSLLNYNNTNIGTLSANAFDSIFYTAPIVDASGLIIESTGNSGHASMFEGCVTLVTAPVLDATTLGTNCYNNMFHGCVKIISAPALPAMVLAQGCYSNMFDSCIELTDPPVLNASTTVNNCYTEMFTACTKLEIAPALPATSLSDYCYQGMFRDCIKLRQPPVVLPATTVAINSYEFMFMGCSVLDSTPIIMATTINSSGCKEMFRECESLINVSSLLSTSIAANGYNSMFYGCESLIDAPSLPAGTLTSNCYYQMFYGCINLLTAPLNNVYTTKSPAQTGMFTGATKVIETIAWCRIPTSFGGGGGSGCTDYFTVTGATTITPTSDNSFTYDMNYRIGTTGSWHDINTGSTINVTPIGAPVQFWGETETQLYDELEVLPWRFTGDNISISGNINTLIGNNTTSPIVIGDYCYNNMFNGCTNLKSVDIIMPALTLGTSCYQGMFADCTGLTTLKLKLPAETLKNNCYYEMFKGCTSLNQLPVIKAKTLAPYCYYGMFEHCNALTSVPLDYLPVTTLAPYCYKNIFSYTGLTTGPELPATVMASYCYDNFFYHCLDLTTPPVLPSINLANNCYDGMFYKCESLLSLPELPATVMAEQCYQFMFYECKSITGIPNNYLPSMQLAQCCYRYMFQRSGLVNISNFVLPATTLTRRCYAAFCQECHDLRTVNPNMLPAPTLAEGCYDQMFIWCENLIAAPVLIATTLQVKSYRRMFADCISLQSIPGAATYTTISSLPEDSVLHMFRSDTNITSPITYSQIPSEWKE
jgi:hypothetical protein